MEICWIRGNLSIDTRLIRSLSKYLLQFFKTCLLLKNFLSCFWFHVDINRLRWSNDGWSSKFYIFCRRFRSSHLPQHTWLGLPTIGFLMLCSTQHYTSFDNPNQDTCRKDFFSFRQMKQTRPATIQQYIQ